MKSRTQKKVDKNKEGNSHINLCYPQVKPLVSMDLSLIFLSYTHDRQGAVFSFGMTAREHLAINI